MLSQPGSALFLYVAKMEVVEYEKLTSIHANIDPHFYGLTVLSTPSVYFQIVIGTPYVLKLSIVSTDSMDIGTQHKMALVSFKPP